MLLHAQMKCKALFSTDTIPVAHWCYFYVLAVFCFFLMRSAGAKPQRHKHFFHRVLPNKTAINKTPALLPFQHPKAEQDAKAAETLPRCLSWKCKGLLVVRFDRSAAPCCGTETCAQCVLASDDCFKCLIQKTKCWLTHRATCGFSTLQPHAQTTRARGTR